MGQNYRPFYYRIIGHHALRRREPTFGGGHGYGERLDPPLAPSIKLAETRDGQSAYFRWEKHTQEPDFKGFIVGRSTHPESDLLRCTLAFYPKQPKNLLIKTRCKWPEFLRHHRHRYSGNESRSLSAYVLFADHTPPAPPIGLAGSVDSNGVVSLSWTPNREDDLLGYRVYWSNDREHKFIMISSDMVRESAYTDSVQIHTLSEHVYYRIAAVDNGFGHSDFSNILELKRPDVSVATSSGIFTDFKILENGIQLTWTPSTSSDLATQQLLRRQPDGDWNLLREFDKTAARYFDSPPANGIYEYALRSIDDDGQRSELSFPVGVNFVGKGETPPVEDLRAVYNQEKKALELHWRYPASDRRFVIYRSVNDGGLMSYESVQGNVQFTDFGVAENATYTYAVRVVDDATGGESDLQKTGLVRID
ncbi:MAG: fibronectin type III domain-containing protein [Saprospiraceae bacterium]